MPSQDVPRSRAPQPAPGEEQARAHQRTQETNSPRRPHREELQAVNQRERQVQETFDELGNTGDKRGRQVAQDQLARGEVSRELREMRHGEIESAPPQPGKPKRRSPGR